MYGELLKCWVLLGVPPRRWGWGGKVGVDGLKNPPLFAAPGPGAWHLTE